MSQVAEVSYTKITEADFLELVLCVMVLHQVPAIPGPGDAERFENGMHHLWGKLIEESRRISKLDEHAGSTLNVLSAYELFSCARATKKLDAFWGRLWVSSFITPVRLERKKVRFDVDMSRSDAESKLARANPAWRTFLEREVPPLLVAALR